MSPSRQKTAFVILALLVLGGGCASGFRAAKSSPGQPASYARLLGGGHTPRVNHLSRVFHVAETHQVLRARGLPDDRISVLMTDGDDPAVEPRATGQGAWLLDGTYLERPLGRPVRDRDTRIPGVAALPATRDHLDAWFDGAAAVTVMSRCCSGAFAQLAPSPSGGRAVGDTCGFFSPLEDVLPAFVLVDENGRVRRRWAGYSNDLAVRLAEDGGRSGR